MSRFAYVRYDEIAEAKQAKLKKLFEGIETFIMHNVSKGRSRKLVLNALEVAYMWTGKALRDETIERGGNDDELKERSKS